jgi:hypothetical protein
MATFYILPPRESLERALVEVLGRLLPGLPLPAEAWEAVIERMASAAGWPADVFLVPRDDLPEGEPIAEALAAAFGAEAGDRVIEVSPVRVQAPARSWVLDPSAVPGIAAAH